MTRRSWLARMIGLTLTAARGQDVPVPKGPVRAVLDTDTFNEIDDQFAVTYSVLSPERIRLEAIYAAPFHNNRSTGPADGMEKSYEEILRVLEALGKTGTFPVYKGSRSWLPGPNQPVESDAASDLIRRALQGEPPLYVMAIGAPTNVASAILLEPKIKERIVVVWLGGQPHEFPSAREFNLQQDLHASRVLLDSGVRLVQIPTTNVSEQLRTTVAELERFIKGRSRIGDYLFKIFLAWGHEHQRSPEQPWSKVIWDISAPAWLINPDWVETKLAPSPILTSEFTWRFDPGRHTIRVATHINRDAVFSDLFGKIQKAPR